MTRHEQRRRRQCLFSSVGPATQLERPANRRQSARLLTTSCFLMSAIGFRSSSRISEFIVTTNSSKLIVQPIHAMQLPRCSLFVLQDTCKEDVSIEKTCQNLHHLLSNVKNWERHSSAAMSNQLWRGFQCLGHVRFKWTVLQQDKKACEHCTTHMSELGFVTQTRFAKHSTRQSDHTAPNFAALQELSYGVSLVIATCNTVVNASFALKTRREG